MYWSLESSQIRVFQPSVVLAANPPLQADRFVPGIFAELSSKLLDN
jgi:hypothetical protein